MVSSMLFTVLSGLAIAGGVGLILFRHPMNGAMSLIVTMVSLAGLYALLSAKLIFAIQLIVYAGAIMSLVLFIIMFLNIDDNDLPDETTRWAYLAGGIVLVAPIAYFLIRIVNKLPVAPNCDVATEFGEIKTLGMLLFKDWVLPFEIVSILLLVALVGAVILAGKREESV